MVQNEPVFFCHGVPGSAADARLLRAEDGQVLAPELFWETPGDPMLALLAEFDRMTAGQADGGVHLMGFSIGAMVAIKIAAARPERVGRLTLISPAAPLELGNFLPDMAGAPVFGLAERRPGLLKALTHLQGLMTRLAPGALTRQLFAKCGPRERALLQDSLFREVLHAALKNSYIRNPGKYLWFIRAYVADWSDDLARLNCPVSIWHGTCDSWSPPAMADALCAAIPGGAELHLVDGAEHYSTLIAAGEALFGAQA